MDGNADPDVLFIGGSTSTRMRGFAGDNLLVGRDGSDDPIAGGDGHDLITPGAGIATVVLDTLDSKDSVTDFNVDRDTLLNAIAAVAAAAFLNVGVDLLAILGGNAGNGSAVDAAAVFLAPANVGNARVKPSISEKRR